MRDDPAYRRAAAAEAEFWQTIRCCSLEESERLFADGPIDRYVNSRLTGDPATHWSHTVARRGSFRHGLVLGTSSIGVEARILETNPGMHVTFLDISPGALARRTDQLGARFPGRVDTVTADLNFVELEPEAYDLVVSSSTVHHVTNLEHLAAQIDRTLTRDGWFFLEDYVGEPRFRFSDAKKRLFESVYHRDVARQPGRKSGVGWLDASDLSPFCGVRSDETLDVLSHVLIPVDVRTAAALTVPLLRMRPADAGEAAPPPAWKIRWALLKRRLGLQRSDVLDSRFVAELVVVGDAASDAGLILPGVAFATYRKRG